MFIMTQSQQVAVTILQRAGVDQMLLPESVRASVIDEVAAELAERLIVTVLQQLPTYEVEQYVEMLTASDQVNNEEAVRFLQTHIPDFNTMIQSVAAEFAEEFTAAAQAS